MGEPAALSADDRVAAYNLAHDMVSVVENDEGKPLNTMVAIALERFGNATIAIDPDARGEAINLTLLQLAQLVLHRDREIELLRSVATAAIEAHEQRNIRGPHHPVSFSTIACEEETDCPKCNARMTLEAVIESTRDELEELRK